MGLQDFGIRVHVLKDKELLRTVRGCLQGVEAGDKLSLVIMAPKGAMVVKVDNGKNVIPMPELAPNGPVMVPGKEDAPMALFAQTINIREANGGLDSGYPMNNLRVITPVGGGRLALWECAVVCQGQKTFLTVQKTETFGLWHEKGAPKCVDLDKWPQMLAYLSAQIKARNIALPSDPVPSQKKRYAPPMERLTGIVAWFNLSSQVGCLLTSQGDAKVHWSALPGEDFKSLRPGDTVTFNTLNRVPPEAKTAFKFEVLRVKDVKRTAKEVEPVPEVVKSEGAKPHFRKK